MIVNRAPDGVVTRTIVASRAVENHVVTSAISESLT